MAMLFLKFSKLKIRHEPILVLLLIAALVYLIGPG